MPVVAALEARGERLSGVIETATGQPSEARFEWTASLGMEFGRAITKIAFNYLAHEYGAGTALMAAFNTARDFVRNGGKPEERRIWDALPQRVGTRPLGHRIALEWNQRERSVAAMISFHNAASWYRVTLATNFIVVPMDNHAHFFDLKSMSVRRIK